LHGHEDRIFRKTDGARVARKQFLENDTEESWNAGVAYRRENA